MTLQWALRRNFDGGWLRLPVPVQSLAHAGIWIAVLIFNSRGAQPFTYLQF